MDSDKLFVVTAIANPVRWESRMRLYREFEQHMLDSGVKLIVVECAYGERPHELAGRPHIQHVPVRASGRALVWNKEALQQIGIERAPERAQYFLTADADIRFRRADWAVETVHALQHWDVVMPWETAYDLGPNGEHLELHRSLFSLVAQGKTIVQGPNVQRAPYQFGHPGYAHAWTRSALNAVGGLITTAGAGAGDHHMMMALLGRVDDSIPRNLTDAYKAPLKVWEARALRHIAQNVGFVPGTIEHGFHGAKSGERGRKYVERWEILLRHKFDPTWDLRRNSFGVVELSNNKPGLRADLDAYFRMRHEDANIV